ncbi:hypothetical protein LC593_10530 [Nostoc sp. CHAB 5844]|nr:hypothetical protein [Nostoc sp. CHAB 5844]
MLTREELFELFENQYSQQQILDAIAQLAAKDNTINPDAGEFPSSIVDQLKAVLKPPAKNKSKTAQLAPLTQPVQIEQPEEEERISRQDLLDYFSEYESGQIDQALIKLGEDPEAEDYPVEIAYTLDEAFILVATAIEQQKQAGLTGELAQIQSLALDMATGRINMPQQTLNELIEVIAGHAIVKGTVLGKISNMIADHAFNQTTTEHLLSTTQAKGEDILRLREILQDEGKIQAIIQQFGGSSSADLQVQTLIQSTSSEEEFDPNQFLAETEEAKPKKFGKQATKTVRTFQPKTTRDMKNMSLAILNELRKS